MRCTVTLGSDLTRQYLSCTTAANLYFPSYGPPTAVHSSRGIEAPSVACPAGTLHTLPFPSVKAKSLSSTAVRPSLSSLTSTTSLLNVPGLEDTPPGAVQDNAQKVPTTTISVQPR